MPDAGRRRPTRPSPPTREAALGLAVLAARLTEAAAQTAVAAARLATRTPVAGPELRRIERALAARGRAASVRGRARAEAAVGGVLESREIERSIDRALAGPLTEAVARSLAEHRTIERIAKETLTAPEFEEALAAALDDRRTQELVDRTLASPGLERLVVSALESRVTVEATGRVLASPELHAALRGQTSTMANDLRLRLAAQLRRLDRRLERHGTQQVETAGPIYGGLATRGMALALDLALAALITLAGIGVLALVASLVGGLRPAWLAAAIAGAEWVLVVGGYLVFFWAEAGQTPAMRLFDLRVSDSKGRRPTLGRSLVRLVGLVLAIIPLLAGFIPVIFDERRRGLQDFLAGTVVRSEPKERPVVTPPAALRE